MPHANRRRHHAKNDKRYRNTARFAHLHQALKIELQPQGKQQENDANFTPRFDVLHVVHVGQQRHVRTRQNASNNIPKQNRQLELSAHDRSYTGRNENQSEVGNQRILMHNRRYISETI